MNDDNVIVESTGQVIDAIITDTPKVIELSDKDFGYGFAGNLKGVTYQLSSNCVPNDEEVKLQTTGLLISDGSKP